MTGRALALRSSEATLAIFVIAAPIYSYWSRLYSRRAPSKHWTDVMAKMVLAASVVTTKNQPKRSAVVALLSSRPILECNHV